MSFFVFFSFLFLYLSSPRLNTSGFIPNTGSFHLPFLPFVVLAKDSSGSLLFEEIASFHLFFLFFLFSISSFSLLLVCFPVLVGFNFVF